MAAHYSNCGGCELCDPRTPSPSINPTKHIGDDLEVAHASALFAQLGNRERKVANDMLRSLVKMQGARK